MLLQSLNIINYRNISQADLLFSAGINCFVGNNGAGKTNLLDSIYYLSFCKSFINAIDSQNVKHLESFFVIQGKYEKFDQHEEVYCGVKLNQKKQFKRNKKEYPKLSDHIGFIPLVFISPSDEQLIMDGSELRRKYMDGVISQFDNQYLDSLIRYNHVLIQRNKLLKDNDNQHAVNNDVLDAFDQQLTGYAKLIYQKRLSFITELIVVFENHFKHISGGDEQVHIEYQSHLHSVDYSQQLKDSRRRDLMLGYTTKGIHKDDLDFTLNTFSLRKEGSQGQKKTFAISLKLAQFDFLYQHQKIKPILLLDDIFDKLDDNRGKRLLQLVAEDHFSQIFITHTNANQLHDILSGIGKDYKMFVVENGTVSA